MSTFKSLGNPQHIKPKRLYICHIPLVMHEKMWICDLGGPFSPVFGIYAHGPMYHTSSDVISIPHCMQWLLSAVTWWHGGGLWHVTCYTVILNAFPHWPCRSRQPALSVGTHAAFCWTSALYVSTKFTLIDVGRRGPHFGRYSKWSVWQMLR